MASAAILPRSASPPPPLDTSRRHSMISAHNSLLSSSAPMASPTTQSSSSSKSSLHTLGTEGPPANPIHAVSSSIQQHPHPEVHIVKVTGDTVHVETGTIPDSFLKKVSQTVTNVIPPKSADLHDDDHVGPPPPSPPASVERPEPEAAEPIGETRPMLEGKPVIFDEPEAIGLEPRPGSFRNRQMSASSSASTMRAGQMRAATMSGIAHEQSSIDTKFSLSTLRSQDTITITTSEPPPIDTSSSTPVVNTTDYLQPPSPSIHAHRPARRNTTGSALQTLPSRLGPVPSPHLSLHPQYGSHPHGVYDHVDDDVASDIQLHAEKIRRERMEKRAKQQQAEAALTRGETTKKGEDVPLVGNLIGEDHVNYVLMYNMLTGIRIGVSRCQAKIKRPLTDDDFTARHKFSFDIVGNELTPSARYDFKFKDYAPWVFRSLREDYFHLDPADYLLSLTSKYILSELGSPGKSGSFFYFSRDYRFIIKTIRHSEHKFLLKVLKQYYNHVKENPHTLLSRFYGLHRVKLPRGRKIHFVIMNNLFPPHKDVHETYDLKGSTVGREYPEELRRDKNNPVLKDVNWINKGLKLELGPEKRALLTEQLRRDKEMLKAIDVMDYSLLVGIHNMRRGNRDNVRKNTLKVFDPDIPHTHRRRPTLSGGSVNHQHKAKGGTFSPEAIAMRRAMRESDPKRLGKGTIRLPEEDTGERQHFIFYQDEGGLRATDETNENMDTIYYLGVIDILTPYSVVKKLEHFWKGLSADRHKISPVPPPEYAGRFFTFMKAIMRGGEGGESFKP
ncbi:SAICAR synthase-like protein [Desarmillaria ectypa]|nr:SAICAR synthase-like protein [Desarmillaria ectypa]